MGNSPNVQITSRYCAQNVDKTDMKNAKSESKLFPDDDEVFLNEREEHPKLGKSVKRTYVRDLLTVGISKQDRKVALMSTPCPPRKDGDGIVLLAIVGDR
mmetsp:Transcript_11972/g.11531  ORF Transcript_11972/g.11531 Transcript_11972/m.11531 type:complete len:100 (-) Transcript_11972:76-375(-)